MKTWVWWNALLRVVGKIKPVGRIPILGGVALLLVAGAVLAVWLTNSDRLRQPTLATANPGLHDAALAADAPLAELVPAMGRSEVAFARLASELLQVRVIRWRSLDQATANEQRETLARLLARATPSWPQRSRLQAVDLCSLMMESALEMPSDRRAAWLADCETVMKTAAVVPDRKPVDEDLRESLPSEFFMPPVIPRTPA